MTGQGGNAMKKLSLCARDGIRAARRRPVLLGAIRFGRYLWRPVYKHQNGGNDDGGCDTCRKAARRLRNLPSVFNLDLPLRSHCISLKPTADPLENDRSSSPKA
ncbi:MAG: hypothetical protein ACXW13_11225 [Burkholderiaceae bacterium]